MENITFLQKYIWDKQPSYLIEAKATQSALIGHSVQVLPSQADGQRAVRGGGGAGARGGEPLGAALKKKIR